MTFIAGTWKGFIFQKLLKSVVNSHSSVNVSAGEIFDIIEIQHLTFLPVLESFYRVSDWPEQVI